MTVKRKTVLLLIDSNDLTDNVTIGARDDPLPEPIAQYGNSKKLYRLPEGVSVKASPGTDNYASVYSGLASGFNVLMSGGTGEDVTFSLYGEAMNILFTEK